MWGCVIVFALGRKSDGSRVTDAHTTMQRLWALLVRRVHSGFLTGLADDKKRLALSWLVCTRKGSKIFIICTLTRTMALRPIKPRGKITILIKFASPQNLIHK
jgi:hypothetical protein